MERDFDTPVATNGYRWWYVDVVSDDGRHGLTVIAFLGSVFSPYYAWARRRGAADPHNHCAINIALYQRGQGRWALTERGSGDLQRSATLLQIGRSSLRWDHGQLVITIDERCSPWPWRLQGSLRLEGPFRDDLAFPLDPAGRHRWGPIAPATRAHLDLQSPRVRWSGDAYLDSNAGSVPLEQDFQRWHWSRQSQRDGSTEVHYDVDRRDGGSTLLRVSVPPVGPPAMLPPTPRTALPLTGWRVQRATRLPGTGITVARTFEDTPFYARSLLRCPPSSEAPGLAGGPDAPARGGVAPAGQAEGAPDAGGLPHGGLVMHESLDLDRFRQPWVQCLLPFRMPRIATRRAG